MNTSKRVLAAGITLGIAAFVAIGLLLTVAGKRQPEAEAPPPPLTNSVIVPAEALSKAFEAVAAHIKPAVVSVYSEKIIKFRQELSPFPFGGNLFQWFFGPQGQSPQPQPRYREYRIPEHGMGSGIIIDREGHILTNYHVVSDVDKIKVTLADGRSFDAEIVGTDPKSDVAIIRLKGSVPADLPVAELGDSDTLRVGELVIAVGAPFGFAQTVTSGIISATGRSNVGLNDYEDFLQTDAAINPGNSGGPLVNMRGQVIGMNTAIASSVGQFSGVGFAIPINVIRSILPVLVKGGSVARGMLGVIIQDINPELAEQFQLTNTQGALVSQVNPDSPAAKAGIEVGDVIIGYDSKPVKNTLALRNLVAATAPGAKARLEVIRDGKEKTITATVGKLTAEKMAAASGQSGQPLSKFGLQIEPLTPDLARQYGLQNETGVVITSVDQAGTAGLAGLQPGDLIKQVDRQNVSSVQDVQAAMDKSARKNNVLLLINRKGTSLFVNLSRP